MAVKSPCIALCKLDGKTGSCTACLRTLEEARGWKKMSDHRRHQVVKARPMREEKLVRNESIP